MTEVETVFPKIANKEAITVEEAKAVYWADAEIVKQNIKQILNYEIAFVNKQVSLEDEQAAQLLMASLSSHLSDPTVAEENFELVMKMVKDAVDVNFKRISDKTYFADVFTAAYNFFAANLANQKQHYTEGIPVMIALAKDENYQGFVLGNLSSLHMTNSRALLPFAEQIAEVCLSYPDLLIVDVYNMRPEPYIQRLEPYFKLLSKPASQSSVVSLLYNLSQKNPKLLVSYVANSPDFKDLLFNTSTSSLAAYILKNVADVDASVFVSWIDDLVDAVNANSSLVYSLGGVVSAIGRTSEEKSFETLKILFSFLKSNEMLASSILYTIKNVIEYHRPSAQEYLPTLREYAKSPDTSVRSIAEDLLSIAEYRDLASVNQKVETTIQEVEVVKTQVDLIQITVKEIKDKYDELNHKVQESCKSYDDLKEYMDKNIAMLKDFLAEVVKKLPVPIKFTAEGLVRRKLTLYFDCGLQNDPNCLFTATKPYTTESSDWAKWLKISVSLVKIGSAVWENSVFDVYDNCKDIYEKFKSNEDDDYMSYISQPFLTSAEQDNLINQLRDQRFFDLFVYSAQEAKWCCTKCGRREKAERQGVEVKTQEVQPVESLLKMNIGFFSRMKSVWCTLDKDHMNVYDKKKKTEGKTLKVIPKNTILTVREGDVRVVKKENFLYLVTPQRTFEIIAPTKEIMQRWKEALDPDVVIV